MADIISPQEPIKPPQAITLPSTPPLKEGTLVIQPSAEFISEEAKKAAQKPPATLWQDDTYPS